MSDLFNPGTGLVIVRALLNGDRGDLLLRLALDTGASFTVAHPNALVALGYDLAIAEERVQITTASSIEFCPRVRVKSIQALGIIREQFPILAHAFPPSASMDGVLGLDFLRGCRLVLDFRTGSTILNCTRYFCRLATNQRPSRWPVLKRNTRSSGLE